MKKANVESMAHWLEIHAGHTMQRHECRDGDEAAVITLHCDTCGTWLVFDEWFPEQGSPEQGSP